MNLATPSLPGRNILAASLLFISFYYLPAFEDENNSSKHYHYVKYN